jgi:RNA polymerase sigma factor (sigma-70 family)
VSLVTPERALDLVGRAAVGDQDAWDQLVDDLTGLLWTVARSNGLDHTDAADVVQTTWLRLAENLHRLRDPERVSAWLVTTARRESLRVLRGSKRDVPVGVEVAPWHEAPSAGPEEPVLRAEQDARLWGAFSSLPTLCRSLLRVLMADPAPSYAEVSAALDMPVGSIGPRRARCLQRLRGFFEEPTGDHGSCEA